MAYAGGSNDGTLNGTSEVTLVAAPGANTTRTLAYLSIFNADTAAVTVTIKFANDAARRVLVKATLAVGQSLPYKYPVVMEATTKSIIAIMSGAAATTNPAFYASYGDI